MSPEEAAILVGYHRGRIWYGRMRQHIVGQPDQVAFDWAWALDREERYSDVIGFFHTHPAGAPHPSPRDVRTMRAWVTAFGKPLLCVIESGSALTAHLFATHTDPGTCLPTAERFPRRIVIAVQQNMLKC